MFNVESCLRFNIVSHIKNFDTDSIFGEPSCEKIAEVNELVCDKRAKEGQSTRTVSESN